MKPEYTSLHFLNNSCESFYVMDKVAAQSNNNLPVLYRIIQAMFYIVTTLLLLNLNKTSTYIITNYLILVVLHIIFASLNFENKISPNASKFINGMVILPAISGMIIQYLV